MALTTLLGQKWSSEFPKLSTPVQVELLRLRTTCLEVASKISKDDDELIRVYKKLCAIFDFE